MEGDKLAPVLILYRRHIRKCPHFGKGRDYQRCRCPIWVDGTHKGARVHRTLDTQDWGTAESRRARIEGGAPEPVAAPRLWLALDAWLREVGQRGMTASTVRKFEQDVTAMRAWFDAGTEIAAIGLAEMEEWRRSWRLAASTATKRIERLRQMWRWFVDHRWTGDNPASKLKPPKRKHTDVEPFSDADFAALLAANEKSNRTVEERRRMTAFLYVARYTGMRISDIVRVKPSDIHGVSIRIRQHKTGKLVVVPLPPFALDALRAAYRADGYFSGDGGSIATRTSNYRRGLARLANKAGIARANPHRFRHTLATDLLSKGVPVADVAEILGDTPETIETHYRSWCRERQESLAERMQAIYRVTQPLHEAKNTLKPS